MPSKQLDNLVRSGDLKTQRPSRSEIDGLIRSGEERLADAENESLALTSRFDLAYNAAHSLALAAMRWHGYRPKSRYVLFQALGHTLGLDAAEWRVANQAHQKRNQSEYEGRFEVTEELLNALLRVTREIAKRVRELPPIS